jgi:hypothetical protein
MSEDDDDDDDLVWIDCRICGKPVLEYISELNPVMPSDYICMDCKWFIADPEDEE